MRRNLRFKLVVAHVGLLTGAACGLLDLASFRGVTFNLPKKSYSLSTQDPRWKAPPPGGVPNVPCGESEFVKNCCDPVPGSGMMIDCQTYPLSCETKACALKFNYEINQVVELSKEVPDLKKVNGNVLSEVLLKSLEITINNQLNIATPAVDLYVAPAGVTTASDANAKKLGTVASKPPMYQGTEVITVGDEAQQAFSNFAKDFQTPFNILVSSSVLVKGGTPTPQGKVEFTIGGKVEAQF